MNDKHIVSSFDRDLAELNQMVARLGGMAEQQLAAATQALETRSAAKLDEIISCLLYTSPSPRDISGSRMPSSA